MRLRCEQGVDANGVTWATCRLVLPDGSASDWLSGACSIVDPCDAAELESAHARAHEEFMRRAQIVGGFLAEHARAERRALS